MRRLIVLFALIMVSGAAVGAQASDVPPPPPPMPVTMPAEVTCSTDAATNIKTCFYPATTR
jgi:hypothetical protein